MGGNLPWRLVLRTLLVAAALTVSGCGAASGPAGPDSDVTLLLGARPAGVHAGIYVAVSRGFDEAEGLDLTVRRAGDAFRLLRARRVFAALLDRPLPGTVCVMAITQTPRPGHFVCVLDTTLRDDRQTVVALVRTLQRGYTETTADPESAVQAVLSAVGGADRATVAAQLDAVSSSFTAGVPAFGYLPPRGLPSGRFDRTLVGRVSRD